MTGTAAIVMLIGSSGIAFLVCLPGVAVRASGPSGLITISVGWSYGGFVAVGSARGHVMAPWPSR